MGPLFSLALIFVLLALASAVGYVAIRVITNRFPSLSELCLVAVGGVAGILAAVVLGGMVVGPNWPGGMPLAASWVLVAIGGCVGGAIGFKMSSYISQRRI